MKILLWIGSEPNQRALANKIHNVFPLCGIVTETRHNRRKLTIRNVGEKLIEKLVLGSVGKSWWGMQGHYSHLYPKYPDVEILNVENINSDEAHAFSEKLEPDLILVSGTRLVKQKMLSISPRIGILNLHTGLSPYIKGGPNCTNWCIATNQFYLIGNTIMWIDSGIDSGNILTTEFTELNGNETLLELHLKVMEHAHSLYLKSIQYLSKGLIQSVPQDLIATGKTYYSKEWSLKQKINLVLNQKKMRQYYESGKLNEDRKNIRTISIETGISGFVVS